MHTNVNTEDLLYRRQFVLGMRPIVEFSTWKFLPFGALHLSVHPDLDATISERSNNAFVLLGFALNHKQPYASNQDLLDEIIDTCQVLEDVFEYCRDLCGRYVLLYNLSGNQGLFSDLIASRTVYYHGTSKGVWCASQPSTLARILGIDQDKSSQVRNFVDREISAGGEAGWIGDGSMYAGVKHLLPNHYLDLQKGEAIRYWPRAPRTTLDLETAAQSSARILENTMQAATNRFKLSMAVTSGWDSRCLLAATVNVRDKVYYYIQKFYDMTDDHPDIRIPKKLANQAHFPFQIINCSEYPDKDFDAVLDKNVFTIHNSIKKVLYWNFYKEFQGRVNASGNISDLCRTAFGVEMVTHPKDLLWFEKLSDSEYAGFSISNWYWETKTLCDTLGYNLRDLFFWEQHLGNWGSMFAAELDIAIDEFYPFGTRRLVETILAVDERLRPYNNSRVHRRMIEILWPELLSQPINPLCWKKQSAQIIRETTLGLLSRMGILTPIKALRSKLRGH